MLTLALGIAAATSLFSVVDAVLLRPLPFPDPGRLVVAESAQVNAPDDTWNVSYGDFLEWRERGVFADVALYAQRAVDLSGEGEPLRTASAQVTEDFFRTLRVRPLLGRLFRPDEFDAGSEGAVVLSYGLWRSRFGGKPGVVGRTVRVTGRPAIVIGVLPPGADWPRDTEVWLPLRIEPEDRESLLRRDNFIFESVARLAPGTSIEQAQARLAALALRVERDEPQARAGVTVRLFPMDEWLVGPVLPRVLWVLLGAVAFVLLIGCVNVANLLLARAATRQRELAVRSALGAGRLQLVRQMLAESLLLAGAGGALGVLLSVWGVELLRAFAPADVPRLADTRLSAPVLAFAAAVSALSALAFGLAPAVHASGLSPARALGSAGLRTTAGAGSRRLRNLLVASELALSLVLLAGAGLTLRSLERIQRLDPGFRGERVLSFSLSPSRTRYPSDEEVASFYEELVGRLEAVPGVGSAAVVAALPLAGGGFYLGRAFLPEGRAEPPAGEEVQAQWNMAGPGWFRTVGVPLLAGRDFTVRDDSASAPVMVVSAGFARRMFPDGDAVGKRVRSWRDENVLREVVGVVGDVRYDGAADEPEPVIYVPHRQSTLAPMVVNVRTSGDPAALAGVARRIVSSLDPELAVADLQTLDAVVSGALAGPRFNSLLMTAFALLALALAASGVYGVLSYSVSQRTREIGVRMALGARVGNVLGLVTHDTVLTLLAGIGAGLAAAAALTRLMRGLLYGVSATDPATFAGVAAVLASVALLASWVPARRATRVDPMVALRD